MRRSIGLMAIMTVAAAACGSDNGGGDPHLSVVFDGERCDYEGPDRVPAGDIEVSFANENDDAAGLAFLSFPVGMPVEPGVGEDAPVPSTDPAGVEVVGVVELQAGTDAEELAALEPGTHALDCVTFDQSGPNHFWRAAILEVER